ncbi:MAG: hypothetical protein PHP27_03195 [Bacteroidales bacterium]|nr:hypothetical protein [Bacteroidales bacterium]
MKKVIFSLSILFAFGFVSCSEQNDCLCTATESKKAAVNSAQTTYPVYDWGNTCNSISQSDIPQLNDGNQYNINCTDL